MPEARPTLVLRLQRRVIPVAALVGAGCCVAGGVLDVTKAAGAATTGMGAGILASAAYALIARTRDDLVSRVIELRVADVFGDRRKHFTDDDWPAFIRGSRHHYRVLGVANHGYVGTAARRDATATAIGEALRRHKKLVVEILWLKPTGTLAPIRAQEERRDTVRDILSAIDAFATIREGLDATLRARLRLLEYDQMPTCGITWHDDTVIVTHYLSGQLNLESPGVVLTDAPGWVTYFGGRPAADTFVRKYQDNYDEVRKSARVIDARRLAVLRARLQERPGGKSETDFREET